MSSSLGSRVVRGAAMIKSYVLALPLRTLGCGLAVVLACCAGRFPALQRVLFAPPEDISAFEAADIENGAHAQITESAITGSRKNQLMWRPSRHKSKQKADHELMIVVGDSYADDIDMGFLCWPTQLSFLLGLPVLNVAKGGSVASDTRGQLARAHAFVQSQDLPIQTKDTLLIVHSGGNDLLHALFNPFLLFALIADLARLAATYRGWSKAMPPLNFPQQLSKQIAGDLDSLLEHAARLGYADVMVSGIPLNPSIPLARVLVHLLAATGDAEFVSTSLDRIGSIVQSQLFAALERSEAKHSLRVSLFDEAAHLKHLAHLADAATLGPLGAARLIAKKVWRTLHSSGLGKRLANMLNTSFAPDEPGFWHDGHHPAAKAHTVMASKAASWLEEHHQGARRST